MGDKLDIPCEGTYVEQHVTCLCNSVERAVGLYRRAVPDDWDPPIGVFLVKIALNLCSV